ncbi:HXXEE domain-containing protein [Brevibacterium linens]|uniref:HXXEE domain-containing protein n=1 Tax=Brevibacterium linens TaxID=1703 RepID=UPI003519585A
MNLAPALTAIGKRPLRGDDRRLATLWLVTAGVVVLHNVEEWLFDMTGWVAAHPELPGRALHGDQAQFEVALVIVTATVLALAVTAVALRPRWSAEVLVYVAYAIAINGASHALLSLVTWSPMPGVITGVIMLLPVGSLVIHVLPSLRWTVSSVIMMVIAAGGVAAGALALASVLTGVK